MSSDDVRIMAREHSSAHCPLQVRIWAQTRCHTRRLQGAMMQVVQAQGPMAMPVVGTVCGPMPMVCQAPVVPRINSVT